MIWRLLASVLVVSDQGRRQRQIMKHEQAMNDRLARDLLDGSNMTVVLQ